MLKRDEIGRSEMSEDARNAGARKDWPVSPWNVSMYKKGRSKIKGYVQEVRAPFCTTSWSLASQQLVSAGISALSQVGTMFEYLTVLQSWPGSCLVGEPHSRESTFAAVLARRTTDPHVNKGRQLPLVLHLRKNPQVQERRLEPCEVAKPELCWIQKIPQCLARLLGSSFWRKCFGAEGPKD